MPIQNVSTLYQRIQKGAEGGHEFARFIRSLLYAEFSSLKTHFVSESDASGDHKKLDAYLQNNGSISEMITGFQFKFYPANLSSNQKAEIIHSLEAAREANPLMKEFILITPEDWHKEQLSWFDKLKSKHEGVYEVEYDGILFFSFSLAHWGHSKIIELALKHDHVGSYYFPELFPIGVGKFKLSMSRMEHKFCGWQSYSSGSKDYYLDSILELDLKKTSDPVFDFQFKNSTNEIHLLNRIEIHLEEQKVMPSISGFPPEQFLRSIGILEYKLDFSKSINTLEFSDPVIFSPNSPTRFHLQLKNFNKDCPWKKVGITFWFFFDELTLPSDKFSLTF